jgi:hypothetical protein
MMAALPGGKSITAKRVPLGGGGVPITHAPRSSGVSPTAMSAGIRSVHQIMVETMAGAGYFALVAAPSMRTLATWLASCPVTILRTGG